MECGFEFKFLVEQPLNRPSAIVWIIVFWNARTYLTSSIVRLGFRQFARRRGNYSVLITMSGDSNHCNFVRVAQE